MDKKEEKLEKEKEELFFFQFYLKGKSENKTQFIHTRNCNKFFSHREGNNVNSHSFLQLCSGQQNHSFLLLTLFVDQLPTLSKTSSILTEHSKVTGINNST